MYYENCHICVTYCCTYEAQIIHYVFYSADNNNIDDDDDDDNDDNINIDNNGESGSSNNKEIFNIVGLIHYVFSWYLMDHARLLLEKKQEQQILMDDNRQNKSSVTTRDTRSTCQLA